jgi:hypothetical protein
MNRPLQFQKRRQQSIRVHKETFPSPDELCKLHEIKRTFGARD